jgi:small-conductance mechanosensitive channel
MRHLFHFESRRQPLALPHRFALRLLRNALWSLGFILVWLIVGMAGYKGFEGMSLIDAFVNAAMILSGMGPVQTLNTAGGKIFAGLYAIISGIVIFGIAGVALAPLFHRMMHRFHLEDDEAASPSSRK